MQMTLMEWLPSMLLIFCRVTAFVLTIPIFGRNVPAQVKIGMSVFITIVIWMTMSDAQVLAFNDAYILSIVKEIIVGLVLGYLVTLFFSVFQIAGTLIDTQMGLGMATILDPVTGTSSPLMSNFKYIIALLLFLSINGHHLLIRGIVQSYQWVPIRFEQLTHMMDGSVPELLLRSLGIVFSLGVQLSAPFIAVLFLIDLGLGVLAKTAPQMNIFVIGVPIKVTVGFILFILLIPGFAYLFQVLFERMLSSLETMIRTVGG